MPNMEARRLENGIQPGNFTYVQRMPKMEARRLENGIRARKIGCN